MNKADLISVKELSIKAGNTLNIVRYGDFGYLKHTQGESGTPSTYLLNGASDPITVEVVAELQVYDLANPLVVSVTEYIEDDKGSLYGKIYLPKYTVEDVDGSGNVTIVGEAPKGRFGGK